MHDLERELKSIMNQYFWSRFSYISQPQEIWYPPTDVYETNKSIVIKMELPGVNHKDIQVILDGRKLVIQGIRKEQSSHAKIAFRQMEIHYGAFRRIISLPSYVNTKGVKAKYEFGFLEIVLHFSEEQLSDIVVINIE